MPHLAITIPHSLPPAEALKRIQNLLKEAKKEFGDKITELEEDWQGNEATFSFRAMGFPVSGSLVVKKKEVEMEGKLPWAALPFKGRIEQTIRENAEKILK